MSANESRKPQEAEKTSQRQNKSFGQQIRDYGIITVASLIYAVAVSLFLDPNSLAPGGVTGIAIILNRITGLETGTWMMAIPVTPPGARELGSRNRLTETA